MIEERPKTAEPQLQVGAYDGKVIMGYGEHRLVFEPAQAIMLASLLLKHVAVCLEKQPDSAEGAWWCEIHRREATHVNKDGAHVCDPHLPGITLPCRTHRFIRQPTTNNGE